MRFIRDFRCDFFPLVRSRVVLILVRGIRYFSEIQTKFHEILIVGIREIFQSFREISLVKISEISTFKLRFLEHCLKTVIAKKLNTSLEGSTVTKSKQLTIKEKYINNFPSWTL
jgi:hypothetical protein